MNCACGNMISQLAFVSGATRCDVCQRRREPGAHHRRALRLKAVEERAIKAQTLPDLAAVVVDLITILRTQP